MQYDLYTSTQSEQKVGLSNGPAVVDPNLLPDILNQLDRVDTIALDVETTGLDYMRDQLHGIAVSTPVQDWYITGQAMPAAIPHLAEIVANPNKLTVGHNIKFDLHFLTRQGIKPARIADTMIAAYLCNENRELGLKPLAHSVLGMADLPSFGDLLKDAKKKMRAKKLADVTIYDVDLALLSTYAARDTRLTLKLWEVMQYELSKEGMTEIFWNTEMQFLWSLLDMENNGMHVDGAAVAALRSDLEAERSKHLEAWINLTGGINHNSSKQVRELLFKRMKLPAQDKTANGDDSVNALTLQRLEPMDHSGIVHALRGIRQYEKLIETFITMLEDKPFEGLLHGNFNQTGTVTGRLSSSDPNQQNIPSRGELGKKVRTCFDAPAGYSVVSIDYSQIELRLLTNESKDENFMKIFAEGGDPHAMTAGKANVSRAVGKAQPLDALILTRQGWRKMGSIQAGDYVIGVDGRPTKVLAVYPQGERPIFKVTFNDGSSTECDAEHLWTVRDRSRRPWTTLPLKYIAEHITEGNQITSYHYEIPLVEPVQFPKQELPVHPYLMGLLLGDGCFTGGSVILSIGDDEAEEMVQRVSQYLPTDTIIRHTSGTGYLLVKKNERNQPKPSSLLEGLRQAGVWGLLGHNKHIPDQYLFASVDQRIELLRGLMDADGMATKDQVIFTSVSEQLRDGMIHLVRSLGGIASMA
jgi:hypothetical protein